MHNNNNVILRGEIETPLEFSHEVYGEGFYKFTLKVKRLSETNDYIPITVSERLIKNMDLTVGTKVRIEGQLRSYNNYSDVGNKLLLTVFVRDIELIDQIESEESPNEIVLTGYICKKPVYRKTPFGREITDILLAVNRAYNKSDYIPLIAWGRNARYIENAEVGQKITIWGRVQSREYQKKISEDEYVTKTAYEVSVSKLEVHDEEQPNQKASQESQQDQTQAQNEDAAGAQNSESSETVE